MTQLRFASIGFFVLFAAAAGLAFAGVGCGGTECGPGTQRVDGQCLSADDVDCGPGTIPDGDRCIVDEAGCSTGTTYNSERHVCVSAVTECEGENVTLEDGECVSAISCGEGASLDDQGRCVADVTCPEEGAVRPDPDAGRCVVAAGACGNGTELSAQGTCVVADGACADGLQLSEEGVCVPTGEVCGDKTSFDEETGLCLPDETCQMGDVVVDGVCVSPAEKLASNPDATENEEDDPLFGGTPTPIQAASQSGETTVFTGTIAAPTDRDGDGDLDQDRDYFEFEADAGDWYTLAIQSTGLPQPHVVVTGPNGYQRSATNGLEAGTARKLAIPYAGTYRIEVAAHSVASREDFGPAGDDEWTYVGSLETLDTPSAQSVDITSSNLQGDARNLEDNLYRIQGVSSGSLLQFSTAALGDDVTASVSFWRDPTTLSRHFDVDSETSRTVVTPDTSSGEFLLLVDWHRLEGPNDEYTFAGKSLGSVEQLGHVGADSSATSTPRQVMDSYAYTFTVPAGQVVELTQTNADRDRADLTLRDATGAVLRSQDTRDRRSTSTTGDPTPDPMYGYADTESSYIVEVEPDRMVSSLDDFELRVRTSTPSDLGSGQPVDTLQTNVTESTGEGYSAWGRLELTGAATVGMTLAPDSNDNVAASLRSTDFQTVSSGTGAGDVELAVRRLEAGSFLVELEALGGPIDEYDATVSLTTPPLEETEPNDSAPAASSGEIGREHLGTHSSGDLDYWRLDLQQARADDEVVQVTVFGEASEYDCLLLDSNQNAIDAQSGKSEGCSLYAGGLDSGTHYLLVRPTNDGTGDYVLDIQEYDGVTESSSNDSANDADAIDYGDFESGHRLYGRVSADDTVDWFQFTLPNDIGQESYLAIDFDMYGPSPIFAGHYQLLNSSQSVVANGTVTRRSDGIAARGLTSGTYYLRVETASTQDIGARNGTYFLAWDQIYTPDTSVAASPATSIPDGSSTTSSVTASNCSKVDSVAVAVDVSHSQRAEVSLDLAGPGGSPSATLKPGSFFGYEIDDVRNVYPLGTASEESLDDFGGITGNGEWTLEVGDTVDFRDPPQTGELQNWRLLLDCQ